MKYLDGSKSSSSDVASSSECLEVLHKDVSEQLSSDGIDLSLCYESMPAHCIRRGCQPRPAGSFEQCSLTLSSEATQSA